MGCYGSASFGFDLLETKTAPLQIAQSFGADHGDPWAMVRDFPQTDDDVIGDVGHRLLELYWRGVRLESVIYRLVRVD